MKIIGLTGGIATGKSTVSKMLVERGFEVIDADVVARDLQVKGSPVLVKLIKTFGLTILDADGNLDRAKLGNIVFGSESKRLLLNEVMHPAIKAEFGRRISQVSAEVVFLDVPLLFEAGFDSLTDRNLVISVAKEKQLERLMLRNDLMKVDAVARIDAQMPLDEKIARGDDVIENNGSLQDLAQQVDKFLEGLS